MQGRIKRHGSSTATRRQRTRSSDCASGAQRRGSSVPRSSCSRATQRRGATAAGVHDGVRRFRGNHVGHDAPGAAGRRALQARKARRGRGRGTLRRRRSARRRPRRPGALAERTLARSLTRRGSPDAHEPAGRSLALSAGVEFPFLRVAALEASAEVEQARGGSASACGSVGRGSFAHGGKGQLDRSCTHRCACIDARVMQLSRIASASGRVESDRLTRGDRRDRRTQWPGRARAQPRRAQPQGAQPRRTQPRGHSLEEHDEAEEDEAEKDGAEHDEADTTSTTATSGRRKLSGSERKPLPGARRAGTVAARAQVEVTVIVPSALTKTHIGHA